MLQYGIEFEIHRDHLYSIIKRRQEALKRYKERPDYNKKYAADQEQLLQSEIETIQAIEELIDRMESDFIKHGQTRFYEGVDFAKREKNPTNRYGKKREAARFDSIHQSIHRDKY